MVRNNSSNVIKTRGSGSTVPIDTGVSVLGRAVSFSTGAGERLS
jgi:hypothetical protein